jgi:hypothetical protein
MWTRFALAALLLPTGGLTAQTDYYNTDAGRPLRVEDAYPLERHAFELQLAPLRLERARGGSYSWEVEPELAYGILPGAQLEIGFPLVHVDDPAGDGITALAGIHAGALYNLNTESRTIPAMALAAAALFPVGGLAAERTEVTVTGLATRTLPGARLHLNGGYTFGDGEDRSGWLAGLAVDHTWPLQAILVGADVYAEWRGSDPAWVAEAGVRFQSSPQLALDLGVGRRLNGPEEGDWFFTVGAARSFALRALLPGRP